MKNVLFALNSRHDMASTHSTDFIVWSMNSALIVTQSQQPTNTYTDARALAPRLRSSFYFRLFSFASSIRVRRVYMNWSRLWCSIRIPDANFLYIHPFEICSISKHLVCASLPISSKNMNRVSFHYSVMFPFPLNNKSEKKMKIKKINPGTRAANNFDIYYVACCSE